MKKRLISHIISLNSFNNSLLQNVEDRFPCHYFKPPPQCMPDMYKHDDCITAYRSFYRHDKSRFAKWQYSDVPKWYT